MCGSDFEAFDVPFADVFEVLNQAHHTRKIFPTGSCDRAHKSLENSLGARNLADVVLPPRAIPARGWRREAS
jgi:hypothetical protein